MNLSMKLSIIAGTILPISVSALAIDSNLSQIDAQQQQRQRQQQVERANRLQSRPDVRLDVTSNQANPFPQNETPCFDIYKISLLDYAADNHHSPSQFQLALTKTARDFNLKLPLCIGMKGINALVS